MAGGHSVTPSAMVGRGAVVSPSQSTAARETPVVRHLGVVPRPLAGRTVVGTNTRGFHSASLADEGFLIVDAVPLDAHVFLDGRFLGSARDILARALPLSPGGHAIAITLPGYRSYLAPFDADPSGFSTRIRVRLRSE